MWYEIRRSRGKAFILMYYATASEVKKDVKDEVVTLNPKPVLGLNLMRLDLVPQSRKKKKG